MREEKSPFFRDIEMKEFNFLTLYYNKGKKMDVSYLTDKTLLNDTKTMVKQEKNLTLKILFHLREIENRLLFSSLNYSSLFEYCLKELQYSEQESALRISALRLLKVSPKVEKKIEQGKISLTQASEIQRHLQRQTDEFRSEEKTLSLIDSLEGKSVRDTKAHLQNLEGKKPTFINIKISPELAEKIALVKKETGLFSEEEVLALLCEKYLKEVNLKKEKEHERQKKSLEKLGKPEKLEKLKIQDPVKRALTTRLKRIIQKRSQSRCEIISEITGERCLETRGLEFHHKIPFCQGGATTEDNIIHICGPHHKRAGVEFFGPHFFNGPKVGQRS